MKWVLSLFLFLSITGCETMKIHDYKFYYQFHPKIGGGATKFGVLSHDFVDMTQENFDKIKWTMVMMPPETWEMIAVDLLQACRMLKKDCEQEVKSINAVFSHLIQINSKFVKD